MTGCYGGHPGLESIESLECELKSMLTGARVRGGVKERGRGRYEISYQPVTTGRNLFHIRVCGLNIQGTLREGYLNHGVVGNYDTSP